MELGFEWTFAGICALAGAVFVGVFRLVKNGELVARRFQVAASLAASSLLVAGAATQWADVALFPALSAAGTGAVLAIGGHAAMTKKKAA